MSEGRIRIHWAIVMSVISFGLLVVLALLGCTDRFSLRHLRSLAEQAELERLGISDLQLVSDANLADRLGGNLYEYQTAQGPHLLWVSADGSEAHVLGVDVNSQEFLVTDLDTDGEQEFIFVEDHGSGLYIERVVGYTVGEWTRPNLAAYVSQGVRPIQLQLSEERSRLEVLCDDQVLGWFQADRASGQITYEDVGTPVVSCLK